MTFEDTVQLQATHYDVGYAIVGKRAFAVDDDGNITDEVFGINSERAIFDENMNPKEPCTQFIDLGKGFISFNSSAQKVRLNDGSEYTYSYYVILPIKKKQYHLLPREGDHVRIVKSDGTIDKTLEVRGFVTYKKRYLKIWL